MPKAATCSDISSKFGKHFSWIGLIRSFYIKTMPEKRKNDSKLFFITSKVLAREQPPKLKKFWDHILENFLHITTIHAVNTIFQKTSKLIERLLWSIGFIIALFIFTNITWKIAHIYRFKPMKTVISDLQLPVFKIPFPEVTICNRNRLNWQRYEEAKEKFLLAKHHTFQYEEVFLEALNAYDTLQFGKFDNFKNLSFQYPPILLRDLNYINFTHVIELMSWKCYEIFSECSWFNRTLDCCDIFEARKSQRGLCLAFNSVETEEGMRKSKKDSYYPWRSMGMNPRHGLKLRVHMRETLQSPRSRGEKGILLMFVEPDVWAYQPYDVPTSTKAMASISAYMHFYDEYTRLFPANVRECVFEDELGSLFYKTLNNHKYMFENCQSECEQEYLLKFCNCTVDMFYPPAGYKACTLTDLPCLYQHNEVLQNFEQLGEHGYVAHHAKGMNCPCYFNCKSLNYFVNVHVDHMPDASVDLNNTDIELSVYFLWDTIKVYKTTPVYTLIDLMASLGGLAGLCLGCSLVGLTEIVYFFLIDVPTEGIRHCQSVIRFKAKRKKRKQVKKVAIIK